jgi:hypothetical protein
MVFMDEKLRTELLRRVATDQEARLTLDAAAMAAVDGENLPWLRQVIADGGWPGSSRVGEDGANAAWLLVQQAYLTDRVLLHEGKAQEYGTQAIARDGRFVPRALRDRTTPA